MKKKADIDQAISTLARKRDEIKKDENFYLGKRGHKK